MATMQQLVECIAKFERERIAAECSAELALAHWFHDAVHNVRGHHNEQRSADSARTALGARDAELLIDIDLSILDAPAARFADRDPRYGTTGVRSAYEAQAQRDLRAAMG